MQMVISYDILNLNASIRPSGISRAQSCILSSYGMKCHVLHTDMQVLLLLTRMNVIDLSLPKHAAAAMSAGHLGSRTFHVI